MTGIEEHIRRAIEQGKFDNLPGEGKPLTLDDNPYEDPEWRMAYRLLRESGYSLPWIESRKEISDQLNSARSGLKRAWEWRRRNLAESQPDGSVDEQWQRAVRAFYEKIEQINQQISTYNLAAPSSRFQLMMLDADREMEKTQAG